MFHRVVAGCDTKKLTHVSLIYGRRGPVFIDDQLFRLVRYCLFVSLECAHCVETHFVGCCFVGFFWEASLFRWNMYTAPAYFMTAVVAAILVLITFFFQDRTKTRTTKKIKKKSVKRTAIDDHANQMTFVGLTIYDCCIFGCMLLNVSTKGNIGVFETLGVSIAESHFGIYSAQAGTIVACCGTVGVVSLLSMGYLAVFVSDIQLICGGMVVMATGILSLAFLEENNGNPSWKYTLAIFMLYSVGYPIGHTAVIGLFSKRKSRLVS